jgi:pimeloyl-ACP methyl ester carboxylesterase
MSEDRYVDIMGLRTRYRQVGASGPAVLLVHGIYSSIEDWQGNIGPLAERYRVWAVDLPGCGRTDKPADFDLSLDGQVAFLRAFVAELGLESFHLVGHSMGGRLSLGLTRAEPARVRSLTLVSPAVIGYETYILFRLSTLPGLGELLTWPNRFGMRTLMREVVYDKSVITDEIVRERLAFARMPGAQGAFLRTLRGLATLRGFRPDLVRDLHAWLGEIDLPLMTIWGAQDKLAPAHHLRFIEQVTKVARKELYDRCGHLPQLEHKDRFNADLGAFLADVDRA